MRGQLAATEPYTTRFETEVIAVDGRDVRLETSYFYADRGGQPADRGTIGDVPVTNVRFDDGDIVHELAEAPRFDAGHTVLCSIEWSFRMYCMRAHTAGHVLYGVCRRRFSDLEYRGLEIDEQSVRVDLSTTESIDDAALIEVNEAINRVVWESRPVDWRPVSADDVQENGRAVCGGTETTGSDEPSRIVTIGDANRRARGEHLEPWETVVCGGTHVRNTREIGPVTVLGRSNPSPTVTRIELAVGPRALERRTVEKRAAFAAKAALGVSVADVPAEFDRREP